MNRTEGSFALLLLSALGLMAIHAYAPRGLYSFGGHGHLVYWLARLVLALLFLTHSFIATVMWAQRERWDAVDESTFRWIGIKAEFWLFYALTSPERPGISLPALYLFFMVLLTTVDLDVRMFNRYVLSRSRLDCAGAPE